MAEIVDAKILNNFEPRKDFLLLEFYLIEISLLKPGEYGFNNAASTSRAYCFSVVDPNAQTDDAKK